MPATPREKPKPTFVYRPTPKQIEFHQDLTRFRVVCAGRRSGKTYAAIQEITELCYRNKNQKVWWCSFNYEKSELGLRKFLDLFPKGSVEHERRISNIVNKQPKRLEFHNNSYIEFRSTDEPKKLVGEGLDFVVFDESAWVADGIWSEALRPALMDRKGRAIIISTPDRKNWFYDLYKRGLDPENKTYSSFHWETRDNIYLPDIEEELEEIRLDLTEEEFNRQIEATFLDNTSIVFNGLGNCLWKPREFRQTGDRWIVEEKAQKGRERNYAIGVDVAKSAAKRADFTVITVTRYTEQDHKWTKKVVFMERLKETSLVIQGQRIWQVWQDFGKCEIYIDATSIGGALVDEFSRHPHFIPGHKINPIVFTHKNKPEIIGRLRVDVERRRVRIPEQFTVLVDEMSAYAQEYNTKTGNVKYGAPGNKHDDTVVSLALATMREEASKVRFLDRTARIKLGF